MPLQLVPRASELVRVLGLQAHPEGGFYREIFRSPHAVQPLGDGRVTRSALTCIDFLLGAGQSSAWHRVRSDEAWHLLEGGPLRIWILAASLDSVQKIELHPASATHAPRVVVPAHAWQAAEPLGEYAYVGATVGPGFDFADFDFGRADLNVRVALQRLAPQTLRLL